MGSPDRALMLMGAAGILPDDRCLGAAVSANTPLVLAAATILAAKYNAVHEQAIVFWGWEALLGPHPGWN